MRNALRSAAACASLLGAACSGTPGSPTAPAAAADALSATSWRLLTLGGRPVLPGVRVTAVFLADEQRVAGSAGCNRYFGSAVADAARLQVGLLGSTMMHCGDTVMPQEHAYLDALQKATRYTVESGRLLLGSDADASTLVFEAEPGA